MNKHKKYNAAGEELMQFNDQLCFPIYLCAKEVVGKYTQALKKVDLTYTQFVVMMYFWEKGSSNLKDVTKTLFLDASTLSPIIKKLEAKGFLERKRSKADERNLVITLTPKGKEIKEDALHATGEVAKYFEFTQEELVHLRGVILKLLRRVQEIDVG